MPEHVILLQPACILHQRPFRESSLLLDVFTRDHGVVSILAKGVRKQKSKTAGLLQPFNQLLVSYLDRHELKVLTQADLQRQFALQRLALYCGFYINELLQRLLHRHDPHPELFQCYLDCLAQLTSAAAIESSLRYFELDLLAQTGYGVELAIDASSGDPVSDARYYRYAAGVGMLPDDSGEADGRTLRLLAARAPLADGNLQQAKQLLRKMLDSHLQGRPLKSREVLGKIIQHL